MLTAPGDQQNVSDQAMSAQVVSLVHAAEVRRRSAVGDCFTDARQRASYSNPNDISKSFLDLLQP